MCIRDRLARPVVDDGLAIKDSPYDSPELTSFAREAGMNARNEARMNRPGARSISGYGGDAVKRQAFPPPLPMEPDMRRKLRQSKAQRLTEMHKLLTEKLRVLDSELEREKSSRLGSRSSRSHMP
eukprot:TRINITY_DN12346_c0_g1_i2.p1 TRINITY_DN12346_c0_g1~~TRINITY_DN12346_c0_g1_i2.p1  ORF type:complete len:125 (-),score=20.93 TRINITY_DN12346_c0_g1_i2:134-508(-)